MTARNAACSACSRQGQLVVAARTGENRNTHKEEVKIGEEMNPENFN